MPVERRTGVVTPTPGHYRQIRTGLNWLPFAHNHYDAGSHRCMVVCRGTPYEPVDPQRSVLLALVDHLPACRLQPAVQDYAPAYRHLTPT